MYYTRSIYYTSSMCYTKAYVILLVYTILEALRGGCLRGGRVMRACARGCGQWVAARTATATRAPLAHLPWPSFPSLDP